MSRFDLLFAIIAIALLLGAPAFAEPSTKTVEVVNDSANAVPVEIQNSNLSVMVDRPAAQTVHLAFRGDAESGSPSGTTSRLTAIIDDQVSDTNPASGYVVPSGKVLRITHVGMRSFINVAFNEIDPPPSAGLSLHVISSTLIVPGDPSEGYYRVRHEMGFADLERATVGFTAYARRLSRPVDISVPEGFSVDFTLERNQAFNGVPDVPDEPFFVTLAGTLTDAP